MFVAALGNAQSRRLNNVFHGYSAVLDEELFGIEAFGVPVRHFQAERLAQQGLPGAEALDRTHAATGIGVVHLHLRQRVAVGYGVDPRVGGLDQVCRIIPVTPRLTGIKQCRV